MNLDLQSLIRPLDGYNKDVPGYDHRKGWNDAIMHIMDLQRATAAPASAASDEDNIIAWCGTNGAEWRRKDNRSPVHMTKPREYRPV